MDYWKVFNEGKNECKRVDNNVSKATNPYGTLTEKWEA